jgi:hypothetical protein
MIRSAWKAPSLLLLLVAAPAQSQGVIQVRVVDSRSTLVPSDIQFRRSAGGVWETLDRADHGEAAISFACAPGVQLRADPLNGRYTNSDAFPCKDALTLRVAERSVGFAFDYLGADDVLTRGEFAAALARREHLEDGPLASHAHGRADGESAAIRRLNEASELFDRIDRNRDERVTRAEAAAAPNR